MQYKFVARLLSFWAAAHELDHRYLGSAENRSAVWFDVAFFSRFNLLFRIFFLIPGLFFLLFSLSRGLHGRSTGVFRVGRSRLQRAAAAFDVVWRMSALDALLSSLLFLPSHPSRSLPFAAAAFSSTSTTPILPGRLAYTYGRAIATQNWKPPCVTLICLRYHTNSTPTSTATSIHSTPRYFSLSIQKAASY